MSFLRFSSESRHVSQPVLIAVSVFTLFMLGMLIYQGNQLYHTSSEDSLAWYGHAYMVFWSVFNLLLGIGALLYIWFPRGDQLPSDLTAPPDKMVILSIGGLFGLSLVVLGVMFSMLWWNASVGGLFTGRDAWKGGPTLAHYRPYIVLGLILFGLMAMLASILVVQSEERRNPTLRRLVYGYVTVFTGLMLAAVLTATNVLAFFYVQENGLDPFDWTEGHVYSLSPGTKQILKDLKKPVAIYVLLSPRTVLFADVKTLLSNFQNVTDKIEVEFVNPANPFTVAALMQQYPFTGREGVLVVYDPDGKPSFQFLKPTPDLESVSGRNPFGGGEEERAFKGEQAIISAIKSLQQGEIKNIVYFTQDSGELSLDSFDSQVPDIGLGRLSSLLQEDKIYEVKPLNLGSVSKIPDDAMAVVIAGPRQEFTARKVDLLKEYMKDPKHKLIVLLDVYDRTPTPTGLEKFLSEYGVTVGQDVILNGISPEAPTAVFLRVAPNADTVFRDSFRTIAFFAWSEARSVRPATESGGEYVASPLFTTLAAEGRYQWAEEKPGEVLKDPEAFEKKASTRTPTIPVAVTVRERKPVDPNDVHSQGKPRLVVFGDATWVSNAYINDPRMGALSYRIFTSCLSWLQERYSEVTDVEPKTRKYYRVTIPPDRKFALMVVPGIVVFSVVTACGLAVLLLRRR
ncbi:MAG: GldG family protein [Gemmatales bacterium]|nr:GldG family protein [Gemmatales bacterium]MDW8386490.1 GldG family protein [Gemmatales bacterium]